MIYSERIRQARELSGLTQSDLAERVRVDRSFIAQIETSRRFPSMALLEAIAKETEVQPSFFEQPPTADLSMEPLAFRALNSVKAVEREKAREYTRICIEQIRRMATKLNLPPLAMPTLGEDPVVMARMTRHALGLGAERPIPNLVNTLEYNGFVVLALPFELEKIDAFSTWCILDQERPVIVASAGKQGDRLRFSVAHELGHLILHKGLLGDHVTMENEASRFAAELLLPERPMRELLTPTLTLTGAARLKVRWGVSMQALVRRAKDLGIISDRRYRYLFEQIGALGWKKREPPNLDIPIEKPRTFRRMVELLHGPLQETEHLASAMHLTHQHVQKLLKEYSLGLTSATLEGTEEYLYLDDRRSVN